jgi:hypothetical protein
MVIWTIGLEIGRGAHVSKGIFLSVVGTYRSWHYKARATHSLPLTRHLQSVINEPIDHVAVPKLATDEVLNPTRGILRTAT